MGLFDSFGWDSFSHDEAQRHYNDIYGTEYVQPHHQASWGHEGLSPSDC